MKASSWTARAAAGVTACAFAAFPLVVRAENRFTMVGNYYRERSTRVLQPTVHLSVDAPDERLTLGAAYGLDAISSASIATGTSAITGGDNVFTEIRHEALATATSRLDAWQLGGFFRYSTETDYISRSVGVSLSRDLLQRSLTLSMAYAYNFDRAFRVINSRGEKVAHCGGAYGENECRGGGAGPGTNLLQVHYLAFGYTHAWHKTVLGLVTAEVVHSRGPQDNPYRGELIPGIQFETHPTRRTRFALAPEVRWHLPKGRTTFETQYRFYTDDWDIHAHAIDVRTHFRITANLRLRLRYRFYHQSDAYFWRDDMMYAESDSLCTRDDVTACATADPKLGSWLSHTPGIQLTYALDGLAKYRGLAWMEGSWLQATYNHVFQTNRYGPARLGSVAYSMAF